MMIQKVLTVHFSPRIKNGGLVKETEKHIEEITKYVLGAELLPFSTDSINKHAEQNPDVSVVQFLLTYSYTRLVSADLHVLNQNDDDDDDQHEKQPFLKSQIVQYVISLLKIQMNGHLESWIIPVIKMIEPLLGRGIEEILGVEETMMLLHALEERFTGDGYEGLDRLR